MDKLMYRASKIKDGYILVGEDFLALDTRPVLTPRTALGFLMAGFVMFIYRISPKGRDKLLVHGDQWGQIYRKQVSCSRNKDSMWEKGQERHPKDKCVWAARRTTSRFSVEPAVFEADNINETENMPWNRREQPTELREQVVSRDWWSRDMWSHHDEKGRYS